MKTILSIYTVTAMLCLGSASTFAQTAVGGAQHRGVTAPSQQTRTMSTPRPGAAGGAASVGGPQAAAPKAVPNVSQAAAPKAVPNSPQAAAPNAPQATTAKQNGKGQTAPSK
jgi:hypothetical protein